MNQITPTPPSPTAMTYIAPPRSTATLVARLSNAVEQAPDGLSISHRFAPSPAERDVLDARRLELRALLRRGELRDVARAVADLLHAFPHAKVDAAEAKRTITAYGEALADLPVWALVETVSAFKRGEVERDNHTFAPSVAELRRETEKRLGPVYAEGRQIARILDAKVIEPATEAERSRAVERWNAVMRDVFAPERKARDDEREEMRAELQAINERTLQRELKAHGITDGLKIGVQLRRQLEQMGANFDKPEEAA